MSGSTNHKLNSNFQLTITTILVKRHLLGLLCLLCYLSVSGQTNVDQNTGPTLTGIEILSGRELLNEGIKLMQEGEYSLSRTYLDYAIVRAIGVDSTELGILATNNIGNLFYYLNEPDSALHYYYLALDWAEKEELLHIQNTLNNNIGIIYASTNHPLEARSVMEKALAISILLNDSTKMAKNLINLSSQEIEVGHFSLAQSHLNRAKILLKELNSTVGLFAIYVNLGNIQNADSNYPEALEFYYLSRDNLETRHPRDHIQVGINIGRTNLFLQQYEEALDNLENAYELALQNNDLASASHALLWLADLQNKLNNDAGANALLLELIEIKDSIISLEKNNWIAQSKAKHQFELKQREFEIFSQNAKKRTLLVRVILVGLLIIIVLLAVILRMRTKVSRFKEKQHLEEKTMHKEKLQIAKSKNKELKQKIETINYELVSKTLLIDNKNQILETIGSVVDDVEKFDNHNLNQNVSKLKQQLRRDHNVEQNWEDFKIYFERVNTDFFKRIHEKYPNLTSNDLRLMAFLLLDFNAKEISQILNISPDSVRKRKQRLKEKLHLTGTQNLLNHLNTFAK